MEKITDNAGGVLVNLILGIVIYTFILFIWGEKYLPNKNLTDGIWCTDSLVMDLGLQNGDKVVSVNGTEPQRFSDILPEIVFGGKMIIERNGEKKEISIPEDFIGKLVDNKPSILIYPRVPFIIMEVPDTSLNKNTGFKTRDRITELTAYK